MKVSIVNYGMGNIFSLVNALKKTGANVILANNETDIKTADKLLLPGVGNFSAAIRTLRERNLDLAIKEVAQKGTPILGICLGQQLLMDRSEEGGVIDGLSLIPGQVQYFNNSCSFDGSKVPNIGWRSIGRFSYDNREKWGGLLSGLGSETECYFLHSLFVQTQEKDHTVLTSYYGGVGFASVVQKDNVMGCQFHPEKSGDMGLKMLRNFVNL